MKNLIISTGFLVGLLALLAGGGTPGRTTDLAEGPMDERMQAWIEASTPGEHHKHLDAMAGSWKADVAWTPEPGAPPQRSEGSAKAEWILGGRYLRESFESHSPEMPFQGEGLYGYDNVRRKYFSTWVDSMGTGVMVSEGACSEGGKVLTLIGEFTDAQTKKPKKIRMVMRHESADRHVFTMYDRDGSGNEYVSMEIVYTRK